MSASATANEHHVLIIDDGNQRRVLQLDAVAYSVGRDPSNAIVLRGDPAISRQHALLIRLPVPNRGYRYRLLDGNSKGKRSANGVFINGNRETMHELVKGDQIRFGKNVQATYLKVAMGEAEFINYLEGLSYQSLKSNVTDAKATLVSPHAFQVDDEMYTVMFAGGSPAVAQSVGPAPRGSTLSPVRTDPEPSGFAQDVPLNISPDEPDHQAVSDAVDADLWNPVVDAPPLPMDDLDPLELRTAEDDGQERVNPFTDGATVDGIPQVGVDLDPFDIGPDDLMGQEEGIAGDREFQSRNPFEDDLLEQELPQTWVSSEPWDVAMPTPGGERRSVKDDHVQETLQPEPQCLEPAVAGNEDHEEVVSEQDDRQIDDQPLVAGATTETPVDGATLQNDSAEQGTQGAQSGTETGQDQRPTPSRWMIATIGSRLRSQWMPYGRSSTLLRVLLGSVMVTLLGIGSVWIVLNLSGSSGQEYPEDISRKQEHG